METNPFVWKPTNCLVIIQTWSWHGIVNYTRTTLKKQRFAFPEKHLNYSPPDPTIYLCSLTGMSISQKHFTYRSVQIFKMLFQGLYTPGSDLPHKIMRYWFYSSTLSSLLISTWSKWSSGNVLYQLQKGKSAGLALQYFDTIHGVGRTSNVILTRQTCGQPERSSTSAGKGKHTPSASITLSVQNWCVFLMWH